MTNRWYRNTERKEATVSCENQNVNMHKCSNLGQFPKCLKVVFSVVFFFPDSEPFFREFGMFEMYMLFLSPGAVYRCQV